MRVECHTVDDFLENLKLDTSTRILNGCIYLSRTNIPLGSGGSRDAIAFLVNVQASAVIVIDDGQYLLQYGEDCGKDFHDASQDFSGSKVADEIISKIKAHCNFLGVIIRPGIVSI